MIKKSLYIFLCGIVTFTNLRAQKTQQINVKVPIDTITKLISYKEVVQETGTADELYTRAIEWINSFYKNPTGVTKTRDPQNHKIVGVAYFKIKKKDKSGTMLDAGEIGYTITLEFKDNRYRYELTKYNVKKLSYFPLERWLDPKDSQYTEDCPDFILQVDEYTKNLISSLKKGMKAKVVIEDNW
ncbi:MAG TPA: DUF4468 domain-containing protein [Bacteroidales bacterium]|nr:DUF4468 domain-containing protein [Bacteroidales bacterium]